MNIPEYLERANKAIEQKEFDMAAHYYHQILSHSPANPEALEGMKHLEVCKAQSSWSPVTLYIKYAIAWCLKTLGKPQKAYNDLELIYRFDPTNIRLAMSFADCALKCGKRETAHEVYEHVLSLQPEYIPALKADVELLIQLDQLLKAKERLETLSRLLPNNKQIKQDLRNISANAYSKFSIPEKLTARRSEMEKALKESPGTPEFTRKLNLLLEQYNKNKENTAAAIALSEHYRSGGMFVDANKVLAPVLDAQPDNKEAKHEQARVWRASGETAIAVTLFRELLDADPENQQLKDEYLEAQIKLQKSQPENVIALQKDDSGNLQHERDMNRIQMLQQQITARPELSEERAKLGELLLKYDRQEEAIPILQRLIHEPPFAGRGFLLLGQCFRKKGDRQLAITQFEKALPYLRMKSYSHVPTEEIKLAHYYMGLCKEELGDATGAREAYGQVYAVDIHYKDVRERYENTFKQSGESQTS